MSNPATATLKTLFEEAPVFDKISAANVYTLKKTMRKLAQEAGESENMKQDDCLTLPKDKPLLWTSEQRQLQKLVATKEA